MTQMDATLVMLALFALRCLIPPAVTLGVCYLMNRLVDYWEAQEAVEKALSKATAQAKRKRDVQKDDPSKPSPSHPALAFSPALLSLPCWLTNNCPEERRDNCPAFRNRDVPCWKARLQTEGVLPSTCPDCPRYISAHAVS